MIRKKTLSTQELSTLLNVTETTVKRWADEGKIPCMKTPGGHRKFLIGDVIQFAEKHEYKLMGVLAPPVAGEESEQLQFAVQTQNYARMADVLYTTALRGDRNAVTELLSYLARHHMPLPAILDEVIRPALYRIGVQWKNGLLPVDQEHLASHTIGEALASVQSDWYHKAPNGLHAVCACPDGEQHELGLRGIGYLFECEGWKVTFLGANTPFDAIEAFIRKHSPDLLMLSLMHGQDEEGTAERVRALGSTIHSTGGKLMTGGPWAAKHTERDLECDAIGLSSNDAIELAKDLFHLRRGPKAASASGRRHTKGPNGG